MLSKWVKLLKPLNILEVSPGSKCAALRLWRQRSLSEFGSARGLAFSLDQLEVGLGARVGGCPHIPDENSGTRLPQLLVPRRPILYQLSSGAPCPRYHRASLNGLSSVQLLATYSDPISLIVSRPLGSWS